MNVEDDILKEGLVVTLGNNLFSLPKLRWFSLRSSGLYYSGETQGKLTKSGQSKNVLEFDSMFVRVEKIDGIDSKFEEKVDVYCVRVGDRRKCRTLCFISWEERDFWVIAILHAIAQFRVANGRDATLGKMRHTPSLRSRSLSGKKHAALRHTRSECKRETRSKPTGLRKRFSSLRSRKSIREEDFCAEDHQHSLVHELGGSTRLSTSRARFRSRTLDSTIDETPSETDSPQHSPRWYDKLSPSADVKRHFSSFFTKFA